MVAGIKSTDFTAFPLNDLGQSVTWTPYIKSVNNNGEKTDTAGTDQTITVVIVRKLMQIKIEHTGEFRSMDGYIMWKTTNINNGDVITYNGQKFYVWNPIIRTVKDAGELYRFAHIYLKQDV